MHRTDDEDSTLYDIETTFNRLSVLLTGTISEVSEAERTAIEEQISLSWRPEVFERAPDWEVTKLYEFQIQEQAGIKQLELPPELRSEP